MATPRRAFTVVDRTTIALRLRDGWGVEIDAVQQLRALLLSTETELDRLIGEPHEVRLRHAHPNRPVKFA